MLYEWKLQTYADFQAYLKGIVILSVHVDVSLELTEDPDDVECCCVIMHDGTGFNPGAVVRIFRKDDTSTSIRDEISACDDDLFNWYETHRKEYLNELIVEEGPEGYEILAESWDGMYYCDDVFSILIPVREALERLDARDQQVQTLESAYQEILDVATTRDEVLSRVEDVIQELADERAAAAWSTPTDNLMDQHPGLVIVEALFGNTLAVNGDVLEPQEAIDRPSSCRHLPREGGHVPSTEMEVDRNFVVRRLVSQMEEEFPVDMSHHEVEELLEKEGYDELIYWSSSGDVDVYVC